MPSRSGASDMLVPPFCGERPGCQLSGGAPGPGAIRMRSCAPGAGLSRWVGVAPLDPQPAAASWRTWSPSASGPLTPRASRPGLIGCRSGSRRSQLGAPAAAAVLSTCCPCVQPRGPGIPALAGGSQLSAVTSQAPYLARVRSAPARIGRVGPGPSGRTRTADRPGQRPLRDLPPCRAYVFGPRLGVADHADLSASDECDGGPAARSAPRRARTGRRRRRWRPASRRRPGEDPRASGGAAPFAGRVQQHQDAAALAVDRQRQQPAASAV